MKPFVAGIGIGTALGYGWHWFTRAEDEPEPSWKGTDNDPEDRSLDEDLSERVQRPAPVVEEGQLEQVGDDA